MTGEALTRIYRYRLYPTKRQTDALNRQLDFACDLYNAALQQRREQRIWRWEQQRQLTDARELGPEMNRSCQEMVLQRLDLAFLAFFRRLAAGEKPGHPRFKPRSRFNTLSWRRGQGGAAIVSGRLRLQGIGHVKVKWHRELPSDPRQTRVTCKNGRWYVSFVVEVEPAPLPDTGQEVGVDLGVRQFLTLSDGSTITGPRPGYVAAPAIRRAQRKVARRRRGSRRRQEAVRDLARRKEQEANRRLDAAHKAARSLVDRFDLIAVEDLHPPNMIKGGRWLAREITDQGWSQFLKCLEDKAESAGRRVIRVNPKNTSRRCNACGRVDKASRKGPLFACTTCGHSDDADVNAARNVLHRARTEPSGVVAVIPALPEKPLERSRHFNSSTSATQPLEGGGEDGR